LPPPCLAKVRRYGTRGFIIFNYGARESRDLLAMLSLGITAEK
jgi:hypothetical protein